MHLECHFVLDFVFVIFQEPAIKTVELQCSQSAFAVCLTDVPWCSNVRACVCRARFPDLFAIHMELADVVLRRSKFHRMCSIDGQAGCKCRL
ncbi:hypothetical protein HBI23_080610 [Parastagonospora nodorum]|nr:hypothetical protein HBH44_241440 [Parastagonospora nodorum]KAH5664495.1 hypothetical protein HBI23_080610 [Parastagonospora nodorum]